MYPYAAGNPDELSFEEGDVLTIVDRSEPDWWKAEKDDKIYVVPAAYLEVVNGQCFPLVSQPLKLKLALSFSC